MTGTVLDELAARLDALAPDRRVRVAVDGVDCAGKTTMADALAARLRREVVRTSADDHLHPPEVRHALGRESPEGCYRSTTDLDLLRRCALDPMGPSGDGVVRLRGWDGAPVELPARSTGPTALLLVDGLFLRRPELAGTWDLVVLLEVGDEEVVRRAVRRDSPAMGTPAEVERLYRARYLPAQLLYRAEALPADVVLDTTDPAAPVVRRW